MKTKRYFLRWIILILCLILSFGCSESDKGSEWTSTIETEQGTKVIRNPDEPKYGDFVFDLEEDLVIGDANDEYYFFYRVTDLKVDEDGNIYVCDGGNRRVLKYSNKGKYVRTIGRQGQGPGEYSFPSRLFLDDKGNLCVHGGRSFIYYDRDGNFQKQVKLKSFYSRILPGPKETFLGTTQPNPRAEGGAKTSIVQIADNGESLRTIDEYPVEYSKSKKAFVLHWYTHSISVSKRNKDSFYYGFSKDYRIHAADNMGKTVLSFVKEEEPMFISGEEKELTKENGFFAAIGTNEPQEAMVFPAHRPFFSRFVTDDLGRLYVIRHRSILERDQSIRFVDVFSQDGFYLYRMKWPFVPSLVKGGFLYEVSENVETGDVKIFRHKINNWQEFKEE